MPQRVPAIADVQVLKRSTFKEALLTILGANVDAGSAEELQLHLLLHTQQVGAEVAEGQYGDASKLAICVDTPIPASVQGQMLLSW